MQRQVFVCGTLFHVYVSILKAIEYKKEGEVETLLVVNDHTPGINDLIIQLKERNYFTHILYVPFIEITRNLEHKENVLKRAIHRNKLSIKYVEDGSSIKDYYDFIKSSEINLFYNLGLVSSYFLMNFRSNYFRMLEDGYRNYHPRVNAFKAFKRKYILRTVIGEGRDNLIKSIEVQYPDRIPEVVRHKGKVLDFKMMIEILTKKEKDDIVTTFLKGKRIEVESTKNLVLITQPLSEDKILSQEDKIKVYNNILEKYSQDYSIYIKTHPREVTDYKSNINFDYTEIPRSFPLEFLDFMDNINFDIGITIFSSALDNIKCVKKRVFLGKEYIKKKALRKY
ncbi:MAG: hypothetical protein JEY96_16355 [Bacteroidales bacterium]|nr:hypothetical protein [Bacteroidales bacterium]